MIGSKQRNGLFYEAFEQQAACLVDAAKLLTEMFASVEKAGDLAERIRDLEHKGDKITHDTIARLHKTWITPRLLELIREHSVTLALIDHPWMPPAKDLADKSDWVTADFLYVRLLGDRYAIEERTKVWDKVIIDRSRELADWENVLTRVRKRGEDLFIYINNHYSGHAPETVRAMRTYWERKAAATG